MPRLHVVGSSPRTGTTLMYELIVHGFDVDGSTRHEQSVFERPTAAPGRVTCTKKPGDVIVAAAVLRVDPDLWIVHLVRDPRDVVVSRHRRQPDAYWTNLRIWHARRRKAVRLDGHPRFVTVRYEDLVRDPDRVQRQLVDALPFLTVTAPFSRFSEIADPHPDAVTALGDVRDISPGQIGNWRNHKPRLAAQLALHGSIQHDLERFGYESDGAWMSELDGVEPDNGVSVHQDPRPKRRIRRAARTRFKILRYAVQVRWPGRTS